MNQCHLCGTITDWECESCGEYVCENCTMPYNQFTQIAPKLHSFKATEKLIRSICDLLSTRTIFGGCSFMQYLNRKVESGI